MSEFDSEEFQEVMLLELTERVEELNSALLILEKDPENKKSLEDILRTLHNLKGLFSLSGYPKISTMTHSMENLVTNTDITEFDRVVKLLFKYTDEIENFSHSLKGGKTPEFLSFDELTQQLSSIDEFMINLGNKLQIKATYSPDCKVVSARSLVLIKKLEEKATVNHTNPPLDEIEAGASFKELIIEITTREEEEVIKQIVEEAPDVVSVNVSRLLESITVTEKPEEVHEALTVRVNLQDLDQIIQLLGDLVVSGQFIREIGEFQAYSRSFKENLANFERTISSIQDLVIRMRLVPLDTILSRFPRMIRDLSLEEGKHVDFIVTGRHIGVDRSVIEQLVDPLNHLLRNALSHGIELPDERIRKKKDPTGTIKLSVSHERSDIIIEVWDNGSGIDYEKIRKKAEEKGLAVLGVLTTNEDIHNLLFDKHLSSADETTEISGRGIGLNVVKETIEAIGGNLEIESEFGKFSAFRLIIPISVAITKVLLLSVKEHQFAIPMANIEQILSVPISKILVDSTSSSKSIIVDNTPVPLVDLRERLKFHSSQVAKTSETEISIKPRDYQNEIVILWRKGTRSLGFLVDDLLGERDVVMKPIQHLLTQIGAFAGATVLEGGKVVLIIDPMNFLEVITIA